MFSRDIGIDLGTANTLVYMKDKGIVMREPSVVAVDTETEAVLAVGTEAKEMLGRTPGSITAVRPLKEGVISDIDMTTAMLNQFMKKVIRNFLLTRPRAVVCIPSGCTDVERRAMDEAIQNAGARQAEIMEEPMAAAMGAGLPVKEPVGSMIVDIGGGTSEVAVIALNDIVTACSVRVAGDAFDEAIMQYVRKQYHLLIGSSTAEEIKIKIGSVFPYEREESMHIRGRALGSGLPNEITISAKEVRETLQEPLSVIVEAIRTTLEKTPPEISADLLDSGMILTGGGALLRGIDRLLAKETGMTVHIAAYPMDCVANGAGKRLEQLYPSRKKTAKVREKGKH